MKKIFHYFNIGVFVVIIMMITFCIFFNPQHRAASVTLTSKSLKTTNFTKMIEARISTEEPVVEVVVVEEESVVIKEPVIVTPPVVEENSISSVVGAMSAYGPDCAGCSGHLAGGYDASGGNYYYSDATYGDVRIVAADRSYRFGSIVKVSGSKLGDFYAIVLDRGGGIGFGKRFLFDLLFSSEGEASQFGTSYDVTFELVRDGY